MGIVVTLVGYCADLWIVATYLLLARTGRERPFHWANAVGCVPIIATEVAVGAWVPLVLTVAFGAFGWIGVLRK